MSGLKIPLIVLLVIVIVYVALMVHGSSKNASEKASADDPASAQNFNASKYPSISSLGNVLGRFSPRLSAAQLRPSLTTYDLTAKPSYSLTVVADSKDKFRSAKFRVPLSTRQRCAHLEYKPSGSPPQGFDSLKDQDSENLGDADKRNPKTEVTFTILSSSGQITIVRNTGFFGACVVQLEQ